MPEWEYQDFIYRWAPRHRQQICVNYYSVPEARLHFWQESQATIKREVQTWLDKGWEPVGEIGPSAIQLRSYKSLIQGSDPIEFILQGCLVVATLGLAYFGLRKDFVEPTEFRVTMRRKKVAQTG